MNIVLKHYKVRIYSNVTHKAIDEVRIISDGYAAALVDAATYCKQHYQNAYVQSVCLIVAP